MPDQTAKGVSAETSIRPELGRSSNLADIANAVGVSVSTVSRALRGIGGVSEATTRRIQEAAQSFSYTSARMASANLVRLYCVMPMSLFDADAAGFYKEIIEGIQQAADECRLPFSLTLLEQHSDPVKKIESLNENDEEVGLLLVGVDDLQIQAAAARMGHVVLVNVHDRRMRFDAVSPANHSGGYIATRRLLELGHRRIAHFTWQQRSTIRARLEGYRHALEEFGVAFEPELVFDVDSPSPNAAASVARKALEAGKLNATAAFCASDMVAVGVASAIEGAGMKIPEDFSLIGFDNTPVTSRLEPPLTTINVDLLELGRQSVWSVQQSARHPTSPVRYCQIACQLIDRGSIAAPAD